ncbi:MAG: tRNA uridine-5-carboxymethylaminomethyl(34) synthesis GTPase MnmE, partial [Nitrospira sp. SB0666_bin_27]|nr:tRNA uridine-5-carboxymethylaminomethyl(34) synthesis GTPase MnmE [Nitrospira sp. SB0666_bin_27]
MGNSIDDTICAIATPVGEGGIGIVRISGAHAVDISARVVRPRNQQPLQQLESHRLYLSDVLCPESPLPPGEVQGEGPAIDEALVVIMRKPRSYTGEDVVEIQTHGGARILQATCHGLIRHGARMAQPGEFTKRAFLNGRLDLTQAEAVLDTIQATTSRSLQAAQSLLRGSLSKEVDALRERLIRVLAHVEAGMDFAEE